jgi:hypothetical protein
VHVKVFVISANEKKPQDTKRQIRGFFKVPVDTAKIEILMKLFRFCDSVRVCNKLILALSKISRPRWTSG